MKCNKRKYAQGGMPTAKGKAPAKPKAKPTARKGISQEEVKRKLMAEIARRKNADPGTPSPAKQKMMSDKLKQQGMDKKMQGAAKKRRAPDYKSGGRVKPKMGRGR